MYEAHRAEGVLEGILLEPAPATWRAVATEHNGGLSAEGSGRGDGQLVCRTPCGVPQGVRGTAGRPGYRAAPEVPRSGWRLNQGSDARPCRPSVSVGGWVGGWGWWDVLTRPPPAHRSRRGARASPRRP